MASLLFGVVDDVLYRLVNCLLAPHNFIGQHPNPYGVAKAHLSRFEGGGQSVAFFQQRLDDGIHVCGQIVVAAVSTDTLGYVFASADIHGVWLVPCKRLDGSHRSVLQSIPRLANTRRAACVCALSSWPLAITSSSSMREGGRTLLSATRRWYSSHSSDRRLARSALRSATVRITRRQLRLGMWPAGLTAPSSQ